MQFTGWMTSQAANRQELLEVAIVVEGRHTFLHMQCPFKEAKCFNCGKKGQIRSVCRSRPQEASGSRRCRGQYPQAHVKQVKPNVQTVQSVSLSMTYSRLRQGKDGTTGGAQAVLANGTGHRGSSDIGIRVNLQMTLAQQTTPGVPLELSFGETPLLTQHVAS